MDSSYIGLISLWGILAIILVLGYVFSNRDGVNDGRNENTSNHFPYLSVIKSEYFYGIILLLSFGLVIYSSLLVANVV